MPWPPAALEAAGAQALDLLARLRPRRVLVGCNAAASPDRGTERFLREVAALSSECRLWLQGGGATAESRSRWHAWLADTGLGRIEASDEPLGALRGWT